MPAAEMRASCASGVSGEDVAGICATERGGDAGDMGPSFGMRKDERDSREARLATLLIETWLAILLLASRSASPSAFASGQEPRERRHDSSESALTRDTSTLVSQALWPVPTAAVPGAVVLFQAYPSPSSRGTRVAVIEGFLASPIWESLRKMT